jgi:hypothetical protein
VSALVLNIVFGLIPTFILGASIDAGVDDDRQHRTMFLLVYGLWALTLSMWNWMRSYPIAWIVVWAVFGVVAIIASRARPR